MRKRRRVVELAHAVSSYLASYSQARPDKQKKNAVFEREKTRQLKGFRKLLDDVVRRREAAAAA